MANMLVGGIVENSYLFLFSYSLFLLSLEEKYEYYCSSAPARFYRLLHSMFIVVFFVSASPQADIHFVQCPRIKLCIPSPTG